MHRKLNILLHLRGASWLFSAGVHGAEDSELEVAGRGISWGGAGNEEREGNVKRTFAIELRKAREEGSNIRRP